MLAKAERGVFSASAVTEVPKPYQQFFEYERPDDPKATVTMAPELRRLITFRHLNLIGAWPFKGHFEALFCRNVMIYFDAPTKATLIDRFTQQVRTGKFLYIGHSESLLGMQSPLQLVGRTIYRRVQ